GGRPDLFARPRRRHLDLDPPRVRAGDGGARVAQCGAAGHGARRRPRRFALPRRNCRAPAARRRRRSAEHGAEPEGGRITARRRLRDRARGRGAAAGRGRGGMNLARSTRFAIAALVIVLLLPFVARSRRTAAPGAAAHETLIVITANNE